MKTPAARHTFLKTIAALISCGLFALAPLACPGQAAATASRGENTYRGAIADYEAKNYELAQKKFLAILEKHPNHVGAKSYLNYVRAALARDPGRTMRGQFQRTIIPKIDFDQAPLEAVIEFLRNKAKEVSKGKVTPNILLQDAGLRTRPVNLKAENLPLSEVLFYVGQAGGIDFRYEKYSIIATERGNPGQLKFRSHDAVSKIRVQRLRNNAAKITIPKVNFDKAQLGDVVAFLKRKVGEQTKGKFKPNIILIAEPKGAVTLDVDNMPLAEVLRYVGEQAGIHFSVDPWAIVGSSNRKPPPPLVQKRAASTPVPFERKKDKDELIFQK